MFLVDPKQKNTPPIPVIPVSEKDRRVQVLVADFLDSGVFEFHCAPCWVWTLWTDSKSDDEGDQLNPSYQTNGNESENENVDLSESDSEQSDNSDIPNPQLRSPVCQNVFFPKSIFVFS